ncbi:MAG: sulfotransferase [Phycisphaerales bacterium]
MSVVGPGLPTPSQPGPRDPSRSAIEAIAAGRFDDAVRLAQEALRARPDDSAMRHILGASLTRLGRPEEGLEHLQAATTAQPNNPLALADLAECLRFLDRLDDAHAALDTALTIRPAFPPAVFQKLLIHQHTGEPARAIELGEPLARGEGADPNMVILVANLCRQTGRTGEGIALVERALATPNLHPQLRREALFALGHLRDAKGEYDAAFDAFRRANALMPAGPPASAEAIIREWPKDRVRWLPHASVRDETPVLIVGMPRTGSTLLEQILVSGRSCESVGESRALPMLARRASPATLTHPLADVLSEEYLLTLRPLAVPPVTRVIDKHPGGFLHLGLASCILPGAHVIETLRDPRDVCLSCYFQNFGPHLGFATDLRRIARQLVACRRLMTHWREATDLAIHAVRFETLVSEPEAMVREVSDFLGIEYDPACLSFHESRRHVNTASAAQVRRPLNTHGVGRWRNYETHLAPVLEELEKAGVSLDEETPT